MEELNKTIDNGETEVQIATIGEVVGSASDGSPVDQKLTEDALKKLAEKHKDDEILVDQDHESEIGNKTEAKGWLSGLKFVPGVGLFGKIKWTDIGKKLIENRVFRWLSPSWYLDKNTHEPIEMTSVALTNKPSQAGRIEPIVNSQPIELTDNKDAEQVSKEEIEMTMTKEELVSLIKETIAGMNPETAKVEKKTEDAEQVSKVVAENVCSDDKVEKPVENECGDKKPEAKNAEVAEQVTDEVKQDVKEEIQEGKAEGKTEEEIKEEVKEEIAEAKEDAEQVSKDKEKKLAEKVTEEVIKLEALNSTPKTEGIDIVKNYAPTPKQAKGYAITTIVR